MQLAPSPRRSIPEPAPDAEQSREPAAGRTFGLSGAQVFGSALASATAAFAASSLGVAGTIVGALIGSLILTTASAIYSHSLRRVGRQIRVARPTSATGGTTRAVGAGHQLVGAEADAGPRPSVKRRRLPWRQVAVVAVVGSVLALGGITVLEKVIGHPVSSPGTSGTSIGDVVRGDLAPAPATDTQDPTAPGNSDSDQDAPGQSPDSPDAPAEQQPPAEPAPQDGQKPAPPAPDGGQDAAPPTPAQPAPAGGENADPNQP